MLRRAQPSCSSQVTLELVDCRGQLVAGLWDQDASGVRRTASDLIERCGPELVQLLDEDHLLVQREGVDRRLGGLRELVQQPDAELVAHRPERRAVVRMAADRYATVVPPGRTGPVVAPLSQLPGADLRVPQVLRVDDPRGVVLQSAVCGRTLLELVADATADDRAVAREVARLGVALRRFHAQPPSVARVVHDRSAEAVVARRWLDAATRHGLLEDTSWRLVLQHVCAAISERPADLAVVHRDLHDRHVVLDADRAVGLVGLDQLSYGDPALDLASLLVHLDLRALQGICTPDRAALCAAALLEGYGPDPELSGRLAAYAGMTRLRLIGVECFRRAPAQLVEGMLREMHAGSKSWLWQSWTER